MISLVGDVLDLSKIQGTWQVGVMSCHVMSCDVMSCDVSVMFQWCVMWCVDVTMMMKCPFDWLFSWWYAIWNHPISYTTSVSTYCSCSSTSGKAKKCYIDIEYSWYSTTGNINMIIRIHTCMYVMLYHAMSCTCYAVSYLSMCDAHPKRCCVVCVPVWLVVYLVLPIHALQSNPMEWIWYY